MWRPDRRVEGPLRAGPGDIASLNRLFSDAFTERYRKDGLAGVRVPYLNPAVWSYAIEDAGEGAMVWRDGRGDLLAFNMVHRSGSEGWMGPLAVRTDRQGAGLGRQVVQCGIEWLQRTGARTIGLETMPRTIDNIGFYSRLGFRPGPLTITLVHEVRRTVVAGSTMVVAATHDPRGSTLQSCRELAHDVVPGLDFTREIELTLSHQLGGVMLVHRADRLAGMALWHAAPLAHGRTAEELRILKLVARDLPAAAAVVDAVGDEGARRRMTQVALRCQASAADLFGALINDGWRVQWTDLRLTLQGYEEAVPAGIVLSNWEI